MNKPWLKHYDEHVAQSLDYPKITLADIYYNSTKKYPNKTAISFLGDKTNFAEIEKSANAIANYLIEQGIKKGDRIFMMLPNTPHFVIAYYAIHKVGAVVVPASPLDTPTEATYKAQNARVRVVFFLDLLFAKIKPLLGDSNIIKFISCDIAEYLPFPKSILFPLKKRSLPVELPKYRKINDRAIRYKTILKNFKTSSIVFNKELTYEDLAVILYTGGTTGVSKGVMLTHYSMVVNLTQAATWVKATSTDVHLCVLPFFHGFGMSTGLNMTFSQGGEVELMPKWDVKIAIKHLGGGKITLFAGVPTMYTAILNEPSFRKIDKTSLRACYVGAAPVPQSLKDDFFVQTGGILIEGYGLTESVTAKSANPLIGLKKEKSIGIPWPNTTFKVVDDHGKELPINKEGEILIQSPDLMTGYWENQNATNKTIKNGWLHTGDIGYMDEDGYFFIVDRKKDLIISSGFNVYPSEIEDVLYQNEKVLEACVIGIADSYKGEVAKAFIVKKDNSLSKKEVLFYLKDKLIKYKIPKYIEFRDNLPKSPIGKILKKKLRKKE